MKIIIIAMFAFKAISFQCYSNQSQLVFQLTKSFLELTAEVEVSSKHNIVPSIKYDEISSVRQLFREIKYLLSTDTEQQHYSADGSILLSKELIDFTTLAMENRNEYFNNFLGDDTSARLEYICITQSEADSKMLLENRSKVT